MSRKQGSESWTVSTCVSYKWQPVELMGKAGCNKKKGRMVRHFHQLWRASHTINTSHSSFTRCFIYCYTSFGNALCCRSFLLELTARLATITFFLSVLEGAPNQPVQMKISIPAKTTSETGRHQAHVLLQAHKGNKTNSHTYTTKKYKVRSILRQNSIDDGKWAVPSTEL